MVRPSADPTELTLKFLISYGGKIVPRYPDGKLRYHGGETRVIAVRRSISFSELILKLEEMCGTTVMSIRCQLPAEDLDALISIKTDEDLANLIEEYDRSAAADKPSKIRAFLYLPIIKPTSSPPSSSASSSSSSSRSSSSNHNATCPSRSIPRFSSPALAGRCLRTAPFQLASAAYTQYANNHYTCENPNRLFLLSTTVINQPLAITHHASTCITGDQRD